MTVDDCSVAHILSYIHTVSIPKRIDLSHVGFQQDILIVSSWPFQTISWNLGYCLCQLHRKIIYLMGSCKSFALSCSKEAHAWIVACFPFSHWPRCGFCCIHGGVCSGLDRRLAESQVSFPEPFNSNCLRAAAPSCPKRTIPACSSLGTSRKQQG